MPFPVSDYGCGLFLACEECVRMFDKSFPAYAFFFFFFFTLRLARAHWFHSFRPGSVHSGSAGYITLQFHYAGSLFTRLSPYASNGTSQNRLTVMGKNALKLSFTSLRKDSGRWSIVGKFVVGLLAQCGRVCSVIQVCLTKFNHYEKSNGCDCVHTFHVVCVTVID